VDELDPSFEGSGTQVGLQSPRRAG